MSLPCKRCRRPRLPGSSPVSARSLSECAIGLGSGCTTGRQRLHQLRHTKQRKGDTAEMRQSIWAINERSALTQINWRAQTIVYEFPVIYLVFLCHYVVHIRVGSSIMHKKTPGDKELLKCDEREGDRDKRKKQREKIQERKTEREKVNLIKIWRREC